MLLKSTPFQEIEDELLARLEQARAEYQQTRRTAEREAYEEALSDFTAFVIHGKLPRE